MFKIERVELGAVDTNSLAPFSEKELFVDLKVREKRIFGRKKEKFRKKKNAKISENQKN